MEKLPTPAFITNSCRQLVFVNMPMLRLLAARDETAVLGLRLGEAFACPRSSYSLGGCGTTEACWGCSVTSTVIGALEAGQASGRCQVGGMADDDPPALHFQQTACSFECEGQRFALVLMTEV